MSVSRRCIRSRTPTRNGFRKCRYIPLLFILVVWFALWFSSVEITYVVNVATVQTILRQFGVKVLGDNGLAVDTPGCKIPLSDLWPTYYRNNWNWSQPDQIVPNCTRWPSLLRFIKDDEVIEVTYPDIENCTFSQIIRHPDYTDDEHFQFINTASVTSRYINVKEIEAFVVTCDGKRHFEAAITTPPEVQRKIKYWEEKDASGQKREKPISILWLGVDSTSRRHMQRSFVKTLKVLEEMDFIDFQGYHAVDHKTIGNFFPLLMGYKYWDIRDECADNVTDTFDECPFVWRDFAAHNYITAHLEDSYGSLHYMESGGFAKRPLDYFLHHFFNAQNELIDWDLNELTAYCMSSVSCPQYLLNYISRFLKKFRTTPFFKFVFFTNPFHDFDMALPNLDADFEKLFLSLKNDTEFLENTLIILQADHGDRYGLFTSKSSEAFIERSMVPLYIRIPENLERKHPHLRLREFALTNSRLLTTPFDIHQTLLHVLSLSGLEPNVTQENFFPVLPKKSSLFSFIANNRTCELVQIEEEFCICNVFFSPKPLDHPHEVAVLIEHGVAELNKKIEDFGMKDNCTKWVAAGGEDSPLISVDAIEETGNYTRVLLKFITKPEAKWEIKLRIVQENTSFDQVITEGGLNRINRYGDDSWCIVGGSEREKSLKELCHCVQSKEGEEHKVIETVEVENSTMSESTASPVIEESLIWTTVKENLENTTDVHINNTLESSTTLEGELK